jgi:hypothetical protein
LLKTSDWFDVRDPQLAGAGDIDAKLEGSPRITLDLYSLLMEVNTNAARILMPRGALEANQLILTRVRGRGARLRRDKLVGCRYA